MKPSNPGGLAIAVALGSIGAGLYNGFGLGVAIVSGIASGLVAAAIYRWWRG